MNLRTKVFTSIGGTLTVLFFAVYAILSQVLAAEFSDLEKRSVEENVGRVSDAFDNRIEDLVIKVSDWGQWDDTYTFIQDRNQEYIDNNLQDTALQVLHIRFIVITNEQGEILFKKQIDQAGNEIPFPESFESYIKTHSALTRHADGQSTHAGVITLPEGVILNVARAVTSSDGLSPVNGTIMFATFSDEGLTQKLADLTRLDVVLEPYQEALQQPDFALAAQQLNEKQGVFVGPTEESDAVVYGYTIKKDANNESALMIRVELDRVLYQRGQQSISLFTKTMAGVGVFMVIIVLYLFERLVLRRLSRLRKSVEEVSHGSGQASIIFPGKDEFSSLAERINTMLATLHEMAIKKKESDERLHAVVEEKAIELSERVTETEQSRSAILNLLEDVEEEKEKAESILHFLDSIHEAVYATDTERKIIFVNPAAAAIIGSSREGILGTHTSEHFFFEVKEGELIEKNFPIKEVLMHQTPIVFPEHTFVVRGEKELPVAGTAAPIFDENKKLLGAIVVFRDITEKYDLEQMKAGFLSVAAHQLRTPLGSMRWSMELLLNGDLGKITKDAKEVVTQLYENSGRMLTLVNDLLDVSRIDQKRGLEAKKAVDIVGVFNDVVKALAGEAEKRSITVSVKSVDSPLPAIMVSQRHVYEALENMIANGIKYNKPGGTVIVTVEKTEAGLHIEVADTGIGIPKEAQSKMFSRFFRAANAVLKETDGSGLGLSVVKSYLEEAGATVRFESTEGVGTTFFVDFPESVMVAPAAETA